ncbi:MAG: hypothetical protein LIO44_00425 [Eubacterium sp.]|nr:hypothetical protein [Eubacterium sp.]
MERACYSKTGGAYGKFFRGKAGFISKECYIDFANFRRDGYDFDARYDDGLVRFTDKKIYDVLTGAGSLLSKQWRKMAGIKSRSEFDSAVGRLQIQGYVITTAFEYSIDKNGKPYGWSLSRYSTPEEYFGDDFKNNVYKRTPEESGILTEQHLQRLLPQANNTQIKKIMGRR